MKRAAVVAFVALGAVLACGAEDAPRFPAPAVEAAKESAAKIELGNLRRHVQAIYDVRQKDTPVISRFAPVGTMRPHVHLASAAYMEEQFRALGYVPSVDESSGGGMDGLRTSYVDIPGREPDQVLLTAHHDAWFQTGADDNGSALAILLEAARILKDKKFRRSIRIVAFDGEEEGLVGSARYLSKHEGERVHMIVNMDCMGYAKHDSGSQGFPPGFAIADIGDFDIGDFVLVIGNEPAKAALSKTVQLTNAFPDHVRALGLLAPEDGVVSATLEFLRSDHAWYWKAGIPGIFLGDTANFRNPNYHTAKDLPDTLDYAFLHGAARLAVGAVVAFAEAD